MTSVTDAMACRFQREVTEYCRAVSIQAKVSLYGQQRHYCGGWKGRDNQIDDSLISIESCLTPAELSQAKVSSSFTEESQERHCQVSVFGGRLGQLGLGQ